MLKALLEAASRGLNYISESSSDTVLNIHPRLQLDGYSCGLQSLASILDYYDYEVDLDELADDIGLTRDGCDEDQIRKAIRAYGLRYRTMNRAGMARLQGCIDRDHPVMVPINNNGHWAVFYGYGPSSVYLMDPKPQRAFTGAGQRSREAFRKIWNGWGLEIYE